MFRIDLNHESKIFYAQVKFIFFDLNEEYDIVVAF